METKGLLAGKVQILLVVMIVVLFPLISILVNFKGAQNGKTFYKDLKNNLGQMPAFNNMGWLNDSLSSVAARGNTLVVSFISTENREAVLSTIKPIVKTEQFREGIDNLKFVTFDMAQDSSFFRPYTQNLNPNDRKIWQILRGGNNLPANMKLPDVYHVSLIDTAGVIRRFYDVRKADDRRMLVEHIAVMPIKKKYSVEKREQKQM
jgi:hypothetical protein